MYDDDVQIDEYIDCAARKRRFRLQTLMTPAGEVFEAVELRDGEPTGMRFMMRVGDGEVPPYGNMRMKLRERMAQRDVVRDPGTGRPEVINRLVRAQITNRAEDEAGRSVPVLTVDDQDISWSELGTMLEAYEGFGLRIEIHEAGNE